MAQRGADGVIGCVDGKIKAIKPWGLYLEKGKNDAVMIPFSALWKGPIVFYGETGQKLLKKYAKPVRRRKR